MKLTKAEIMSALRDVVVNDGHMTAPGSDSQIIARWQALRDAGFVQCRFDRHVITPTGRAALKEAAEDEG